MRKGPTEFRKRFNRWKAGDKVYDKGLPSYEGGKTPQVVEKDGVTYNVHPSAIGASELNVTTPEIIVTGKDRRPAWKRMYQNPNLGDTSRYYNGDAIRSFTDFMPGIGDVSLGFDAYRAAKNGNYIKSAALGALLLLPNIVEKPAKAVSKLIGKGIKKITKENAVKILPSEWTAAQDAAIARGDMAEAQRLRDLHFETIGSPVRTQEGNMRLTHATKNKFNSFDLSKAGTGSGNITNTEGVIHLSPYDDAALDVFKSKTIEERNAYNLMHLYANNPNPVEVPLETFIKSWNDKESFKVLRDAGDGIIARGKSPYKLYKEKLAEYESKKSAGKLMPWIRKPESPKDFMEEAVVDGYTINNPANLKSADAVTYDNKGVRIPLGERDNFKLNDIRYGLIPFGIGLTGYELYNK